MPRRGVAAAVVWLAALGYGAFLVWGSLGGFPDQSPTGRRMPYLADKPLGEDGYYMLTVAWQFGTGRGLTYNSDGATTGIQPLAAVLYGCVAAIVHLAGGDRWAFARVMLALGIAQWLLLAMALQRLTATLDRTISRGRAPEIAGIFVLLSYSVFRISTYGLETPLYIMLFSLCVGLTVRGISSAREAALFGAIAGLTALARIDFLVVLAGFVALETLRRRMRWADALVSGLVAGLVCSPWFAFVYANTGHLMPTGGRAQTNLPSQAAEGVERVSHMGQALSQHVSPWLYLPAAEAAFTSVTGSAFANPVLTAVAALAGVTLMWQGWRVVATGNRAPLTSWLLALGALFTIYVVWFRPVFFFVRYSSPLLALSMPLLAIGVAHTLKQSAVTAMTAAMLMGFAATCWVTLHSGRIGNSHSLSAGFVNRLLPPPAVVGAYQSGAVGYFNSNVVNLDGKVNSAALDAASRGQFPAFVAARGITHVVDWPQIAEPTSPFAHWRDCGMGAFGFSVCLARPAP